MQSWPATPRQTVESGWRLSQFSSIDASFTSASWNVDTPYFLAARGDSELFFQSNELGQDSQIESQVSPATIEALRVQPWMAAAAAAKSVRRVTV